LGTDGEKFDIQRKARGGEGRTQWAHESKKKGEKKRKERHRKRQAVKGRARRHERRTSSRPGVSRKVAGPVGGCDGKKTSQNSKLKKQVQAKQDRGRRR